MIPFFPVLGSAYPAAKFLPLKELKIKSQKRKIFVLLRFFLKFR